MPEVMMTSRASFLGMAEEDCLYPISPQLLPSASPYLQPHPLTAYQLHNIFKSYHPFDIIHPKHPKMPNISLPVTHRNTNSGCLQTPLENSDIIRFEDVTHLKAPHFQDYNYSHAT